MARVWPDVRMKRRTPPRQVGLAGIVRPCAVRPWASQSRQLDRWKARPDLPEALPGEDLVFGSGLFVDLVPSTCWFTNAWSVISPVDLQRMAGWYRRGGDCCEVCHRGPDRDLGRHLAVH